MSTPYVGLKRVFAEPAPHSAWSVPSSAKLEEIVEEMVQITSSTFAAETRKERAKDQLIAFLSQDLGVEYITVGPLTMRLTSLVPERHLMKAAHYLLEQMIQEGEPLSRHGKLLQSHLHNLFLSNEPQT